MIRSMSSNTRSRASRWSFGEWQTAYAHQNGALMKARRVASDGQDLDIGVSGIHCQEITNLQVEALLRRAKTAGQDREERRHPYFLGHSIRGRKGRYEMSWASQLSTKTAKTS